MAKKIPSNQKYFRLPKESISSSDETTSARIASVSNGESKSAISGAISLKNLEQDTRSSKYDLRDYDIHAEECNMYVSKEKKAKVTHKVH